MRRIVTQSAALRLGFLQIEALIENAFLSIKRWRGLATRYASPNLLDHNSMERNL